MSEEGELIDDTASNGSSVQEIRFFNPQPPTKKVKSSIPASSGIIATGKHIGVGAMHADNLRQKHEISVIIVFINTVIFLTNDKLR